MAGTIRLITFFVYLVPVLGWLAPMLFMRRQPFVFFHACQALALNLIAVMIPLGWAVLGWGITWIPLVGPVIATASFALVIAAFVAIIIAWVAGMLHALRLEAKSVPLFGAWGNRLYYRLAPAVA